MMNFQQAFTDELRKLSGVSRSRKPLSDKMMKKMVELFVEEDHPDDHKCGTCFMRVGGKGDIRECTVVKGKISLSKGVCSFWGKGQASPPDKIHEERMDYSVAGYIEVPKGFKIQCATCKFFDRKDASVGHCTMWDGEVKNGQCCISFTAPQEYVPKQNEPGKPPK